MSVSAEELTRFVATPPPRELTPGIRRARLPLAPMLVACCVTALVLGTSIPLGVMIFPERLSDDLALDLATRAHAVGTVVDVVSSGRSLVIRDGDMQVELPLMRVEFRFAPADGGLATGSCHTTHDVPTKDAEVDLEYLPDSPSAARIVGTTCSSTPRFGALIVLIPFIATLWFLRVLRRRRRVHRLLVDGTFHLARIHDLVERPGTVGSGRLSASLHSDSGHVLEIDFDGHRSEAAAVRSRNALGRPVGLLTLPEDPRRFLLIDALLDPRSLDADAIADEDEADDANQADEADDTSEGDAGR